MVNTSNWFAELLFAGICASYCLVNVSPQITPLVNKLPGPSQPTNRPPPPTMPTIKIRTLKTDPTPATKPPTTKATIPPPTPPPTPPPPICNIGTIESEKDLVADCSNKHLDYIPRDFGAKTNTQIKILNLSNNNFKNLTSSDLTNFTQLTELIMRNISTIKSFPKDFFSHTVFLEKLDISNTPISDFEPISTFLLILNATNIQTKNVNVSHLVSLKELHLKNNPNLADFPLLSKTAPLTHLDVRSCSMINLTYANLAPFCLLNYFGLESIELEKANATQCCGIKNWTSFFAIPGAENQKCGSDDPCKQMNITLNQDAINVRNECLKRTGFLSFITLLAEIFLGVVVFSGVLYFLCINYVFKRRKESYYDYYDSDEYYYDDDTSNGYDTDDVEEEYPYQYY